MGKVPEPSASAQATTIWSRAAERARAHVPASSFEMWFSALHPVDVHDGILELTAPSEYVRNWLTRNYMNLINSLVAEESGGTLHVRVEADASDPDPQSEDAPAAVSSDPTGPAPPEPTPMPERADGRYTFETFVLGPSNRFAHAAAMAVAEAPGRAYNPLFIYGGVGLGKTHLLSAIVHHVTLLNAAARATYVTSEQFVTEFIRAVREGNGYRFQRQYRDIDVLLVDDIQFLAGKEETQTEFFHTFNALHGGGRQVVIASDRPPQDLAGLEERLRSRFRMGLCVDIQPPDLETRIAILQMKSMRDGIEVPDDAMQLIAERFDSNIRELEGALLRVAAYASLSRRPVDLELATRALEDLMPPSAEEIPAAVILAETARYFGLTREELCSRSRSRSLTAARHVAMYLVRELTSLSLPKIGELFDRDHSTVMYGTGKIERQMRAREPTYRQVVELTRSIKDHARVSGNR